MIVDLLKFALFLDKLCKITPKTHSELFLKYFHYFGHNGQ